MAGKRRREGLMCLAVTDVHGYSGSCGQIWAIRRRRLLIRNGEWCQVCLPYFDTMSQVSSCSSGAAEPSGVDTETLKLLKEEGNQLVIRLEDAPSGPITEDNVAVVRKWLALTKKTVVCCYFQQAIEHSNAPQQTIQECLEDLAEAGQTVRAPTVVRWALEQYNDLERELKELAEAEAVTWSLSGMSSLRPDDSMSHVGSKTAVGPSPHVDLKTIAPPSRRSACTATQVMHTAVAGDPAPSASSSRVSGSKVSPLLNITYYSDEQVWPLLLSWYPC